MNYIYDILLNFNNKYYEFYDWNLSDNIQHIKKIPIFKIDYKDLYNIKNNIVIFEQEFLEKIKNKTEEFINRKTKELEYSFLLTDGLEVIALNINKYLLYSSLLIDEEIEILDISNKLNKININYQIKKENKINIYKTRKENEMLKHIQKEFSKIILENNVEKLSYLYYECFNVKCDSINKIIDEIKNKLEDSLVLEKLNNFLELKNV